MYLGKTKLNQIAYKNIFICIQIIFEQVIIKYFFNENTSI